ncbi:hypothetical protein Btru_004607 [Bulinus truncatus]|nr:hypothetical protein Btru_004607 [Bulinus truncatus]
MGFSWKQLERMAQDRTCSSGTYGEECKNQCSCDLTHSTCSSETGECTCSSGWNGTNCDQDIDECSNKSNDCFAANRKFWVCKNTVGSYKCGCDVGYVDNSTTCVDSDECAATYTNECDGKCTNTDGSYTCTCPTGYRLASDGHKCDDFDECQNGTSGCQQKCNNTAGSFTCFCNPGYTIDDNDNQKCYESAGYGFQVTINMDVSSLNLNEKLGRDYLDLKSKLEQSLNSTISKKVAGLRDVSINSLRKGSVIIDFTTIVDTTVTEYAASKMVEAILSIAETGIIVNGVLQNASVKIGNITVPPVKDKCAILNALEACNSDSNCVINDKGEAYCKNHDKHLDIPLIVGLSVGLPLAVACIVAVIGCIWYKQKYTDQRRINVREGNYSDRPTTPKESIGGSRPSSRTAWSEKDQLVS